MNTTDPRSLHVPPCRSTWSIRRICRNLIPLIALVANTCPLLPTVSTTSDATTTIKSVCFRGEKRRSNFVRINGNRQRHIRWQNGKYLPIIQIGFLTNLSRPQNPMYFDRHPADHSRMMYSTPKKTTKHISIQNSDSFAKSWYCSIVERTLNIRHTTTSMNLWDVTERNCRDGGNFN